MARTARKQTSTDRAKVAERPNQVERDGSPSTYKVINTATNGVLNHVKSVDGEDATRGTGALSRGRLDYARKLRQRWISNYDVNMTLAIVECNAQGCEIRGGHRE